MTKKRIAIVGIIAVLVVAALAVTAAAADEPAAAPSADAVQAFAAAEAATITQEEFAVEIDEETGVVTDENGNAVGTLGPDGLTVTTPDGEEVEASVTLIGHTADGASAYSVTDDETAETTTESEFAVEIDEGTGEVRDADGNVLGHVREGDGGTITMPDGSKVHVTVKALDGVDGAVVYSVSEAA